FCRPRRGRRPGRARAAPLGVVPRAPRPDGGRGQPDHGHAARLRPAGDAGGDGPAAHCSPGREPGPHRGHRSGRDLARPRRRLLLALPHRVLRDHVRLRRLCGCGRRSSPPLAAGSGHAMTVLADMFAHPFVRNAFLAGTAIAVAAGLVGYFVVLRSQVFTGDALGHVAVTGALAALAFGVDARLGLFTTTIVLGMGMALLGRRGRADDVVIGSVFAWVLGLGVLFLTLYTTSRSTANGAAGVSVLFGSILGIGRAHAQVAAAIAVAVVLSLLAIARPLLFASVDETVAAARGVPV